jgi:hypothetical protein
MTNPDTATAAQNLEERQLFTLLLLIGVVTLGRAPAVPSIWKKPGIDTKLQDRDPLRLWTDMTNQQHVANSPTAISGRVVRRSLAGAALLAVVASACGTTTSTSSPTLVPAEAIVSSKLDGVDLIPQISLPQAEKLPQPVFTIASTTTLPPTTVPTTFPPTTVPPKNEASATTTPDPKPIDKLVLVPAVAIPPQATIPPLSATPTPAPAPCGVFGPIPAGSQITSDLAVDLDGDGATDDQVITYLDGVYKLRSVQNGVTSEVVVPDVGVSSIRALGVGNAGEISAGNEIVVRTGGGASSAQIGFFGHDDAGCMFEFTRYGSSFEMYVGATIGTSSGVYCGEGLIADWSYSLEDSGTYAGASAAYFESSAGEFTYLPASDDFSEGLALEDLSPAHLDCFGFGL